eukprot:symbB.v1.2.000694.t1/scaffold41.1/size391900/11
MNFCPFPHSLRDQVWLAVGIGLGGVLISKLRAKEELKEVHVLLVHVKFESVDHKKKFKQIWSHIAKEVKAKEANCLSYEFCDATEDPTKAIIYERYVTKADLDGPHQKTLKQWQSTYGQALGELKFTMELTNYVESNVGYMAK